MITTINTYFFENTIDIDILDSNNNMYNINVTDKHLTIKEFGNSDLIRESTVIKNAIELNRVFTFLDNLEIKKSSRFYLQSLIVEYF